jgi:uncharacterized LabA/DUF88 family protein
VAFSLSGLSFPLTDIKTPHRVGVYVDGYNLYYGRLRGSAFKWLDTVKLLEAVLATRDQNEVLSKLHLFTAYALARFSRHGAASVEAQTTYLRALAARHGTRFEAVHGSHSCDASGSLMPEYIPGVAFDRERRVRVWRVEEKKTDVNLAIRMYRDACRGLYERIVVISNDSDIEPALQAIREDFPEIAIGLVMPIRPAPAGAATNRRPSASLREQADWVMPSISDELLAAAQLPQLIPTRTKPIRKPPHW